MTEMYSETIPDLIERQAICRPDAIAMCDAGDLEMSYRQVMERVREIGIQLAALGVGRNSRVAMVLPQGIGYGLMLLAIPSVAIAVPMSEAFRAEEYRRYLVNVRADYLIVVQGDETAARAAAVETGITVLELSPGGALVGMVPAGVVGHAAENTRPDPDDIAMVMMTSGSTGTPKKVPLSHRNLCTCARHIARSLELNATDRMLTMTPQSGIGGVTTQLLTPLSSGGAVFFSERFDVDEFFRLVQAKKPTWARFAPAMLREIALHAAKIPDIARGTSLRLFRCGSATVSPALIQDVEALFGASVIQSYGMTEVGAQLSAHPLPPADQRLSSVGVSAGPEIRIIGSDGSTLLTGEIGEVVARGPNVFSGYEDDPEGNAETFIDGWYRTGDLGFLDADGYLFLKGRLRQMINRGGEKVNPQEVDDILMTHPAVAHVGTFPVGHCTLGEGVAAAIVLHPAKQTSEAEVRSFVADRLAPFKVPQKIIFLSRMPIGPTGKIDRLALAEMAAAWAAPMTADC